MKKNVIVVGVYDKMLAIGIIEGIKTCHPMMNLCYFTDYWADASKMEDLDHEEIFGIVFVIDAALSFKIMFELLDRLKSDGYRYRLFEGRG